MTDEKKPRVKLVGEDGNAFAIIGRCCAAARKAKWTPDRIKEFTDKAKSGDYANLIATCCDYFEAR